MFLICPLTVIPLRKEASDRSEMVSQILFGEIAELIELKDSWLKVKLSYDGYIGWVDKKQMLEISTKEFEQLQSQPSFASLDLVHSLHLEDRQTMPLVIGSTLPFLHNAEIRFSSFHSRYEGKSVQTDSVIRERWMEIALMYLNAPYLWGGRSPFGIDCSGFTQVVMKLCGIKLLRDAAQQATQGTTINILEESRPGDLAFFDNSEGQIVHVGFILANQQIIHASGKVRIDKLDHQGIYNTDLKKYSHNLRLVKRFF